MGLVDIEGAEEPSEAQGQGQSYRHFGRRHGQDKDEHHLAVGDAQCAPATTKASPAALSMISIEARMKMMLRLTSTPTRPSKEEDGGQDQPVFHGDACHHSSSRVSRWAPTSPASSRMEANSTPNR